MKKISVLEKKVVVEAIVTDPETDEVVDSGEVVVWRNDGYPVEIIVNGRALVKLKAFLEG